MLINKVTLVKQIETRRMIVLRLSLSLSLPPTPPPSASKQLKQWEALDHYVKVICMQMQPQVRSRHHLPINPSCLRMKARISMTIARIKPRRPKSQFFVFFATSTPFCARSIHLIILSKSSGDNEDMAC